MKLVRIIFFLLAVGLSAQAASIRFSFKKYQVEDGLSHNTVWCGLQDRYGFIWFGTSDGLNRYDGRGNKVYRSVLNEEFSLENNFIETLLEDGENIWVGTNSGIYVYDRKANRFSRFDKTTKYGVLISSEVKKIVKAKDGKLWIATLGQGFFIYDPKKDALTQNSAGTPFFWDICVGSDNRIYAAPLQEGLLCFNEGGNLLWDYKVDSPEGRMEDNCKINCVRNVDGDIWMGADVGLLYRLNKRSGKLECFASSLNFGAVHCLLKYSESELLLGTDNGLYIFDHVRQTFQRGDDPFSSHGLSDQTVNAMMWDAEGTLWVMTNLGGVSYMPKETKRFFSYSPAKLPGVSSAGKVIGPFCENARGDIWVGTRNGLCFFDASTETLSEFLIGGNKRLKLDIRSLLLEGSKLWVGTSGSGLYVIDLNTKAVRNYTHSRGVPNSICSDDVLCIYKDRRGNIFVGTSGGLCRYAPDSDDFLTITTIGSMISVTDIAEDMYDNLWIATSNGGVFRCNMNTQRWKHFFYRRDDPSSITSNSVICLYEDMRGTMWFGTNGGGLCSFDTKNDNFVNFDPTNSILPNNVIYAIEQDQSGNFWLSSSVGLIRINPLTKNSYRRFTAEDGLQGNQFTVQSSLKASDGKLYFGGINGFNVFAPERLKDNLYQPPVYVTDIGFPSQLKEGEMKTLGLETPIYLEDEIRLPYRYNSFSLRFVALSYEDPLKNRYSYMLKGVDKDWVMAPEGSNIASYTNLLPGEYVFKVKGTNNDDKWSDKVATLRVTITPPWWASPLAYILYAVLLLSIAFLTGWCWNRYVKRKYKRRMHEFQMNREKELYKSKVNFFVNLVHEIRTPLSLILLPLEKMKEVKRDERDKEFLSMMDRNASYLLGVTNQLLDLQKMESGALKLNMRECDMNEVVNGVYQQFVGPVLLKEFELNLSLPEKRLIAVADREKISEVLVNLMGNALKHAWTRIKLSMRAEGEWIRISVTDDGAGVPDDQKEKIFEAFYQLPGDETAVKGTGIGLAFAKSLTEAHRGSLSVEDAEGGGASFVLSLPLKRIEEAVEPEEVTVAGENVQPVEEQDEEGGTVRKKYTVLLVEDNEELLKVTRDALSAWYRVLTAENGSKALKILARKSVDIIVSDVMMPEMDGIELCARVKEDINYSHIPVVLLTAKTTLAAKTEGMESGADVYIEKPFSLSQLHMQIENIFKLRQAFHRMMSGLASRKTKKVTEAMSGQDYDLIARVRDLILEHLSSDDLTVDTLALYMNMSRSSLYRKMKALVGMSPNDYIRTLRLKRAAELLMEGKQTGDIIVETGFVSSSYFFKCFKTYYGVSPKDYTGQPPVGAFGSEEDFGDSPEK